MCDLYLKWWNNKSKWCCSPFNIAWHWSFMLSEHFTCTESLAITYIITCSWHPGVGNLAWPLGINYTVLTTGDRQRLSTELWVENFWVMESCPHALWACQTKSVHVLGSFYLFYTSAIRRHIGEIPVGLISYFVHASICGVSASASDISVKYPQCYCALT